jgi:hypothetical protein
MHIPFIPFMVVGMSVMLTVLFVAAVWHRKE